MEQLLRRTMLLGGMIGMTLAPAVAGSVTRADFGKTPSGETVQVFTLKNDNGVVAKVMEYGADLIELDAPDKDGKMADVVFGFDSLDPYVQRPPIFGPTVGRFANRIAHGTFTLGGKEYKLPTNSGTNTLHGGRIGWDQKLWKGEAIEDDGQPAVRFTLVSPDGDQGFPGEVTAHTTYTLMPDNGVKIKFEATTTKPTVINMCNHSYFNLSGEGTPSMLDTQLQINADFYTPMDAQSVPTGAIAPVAGTPFDFTKPTAIGAHIGGDNEQLRYGNGYDHNWVLRKSEPGAMELAARAVDPQSGRTLEVLTDQPGMQFYTGNFLNGSQIGKGGKPYPRRSGFALETQHFPDSPNHPWFPTTTLLPGEKFESTSIYRVGVEK